MKTTLPFRFGWIAGALALLLAAMSCRKEAAPAASTSGPLSVQAILSTNTAHIGDVVTLTLEIVHPAGGQLQVPEFARGKEIVLRNQTSREESISESARRTVLDYQVTSLEVGNHLFSSGLVSFAQSDGQVLTAPFPFVNLEVQSTLSGEDTPTREIKDLVRWPGVFPRWLLGLILAALVLGLLAFILMRILSKPRTILQMPPPLPPHEVALQALRNLLAKGWIEARKIEPFYVELSSIVRRYIEDRFQLKAPERTTEEFIREAANSRLLSAPHQLLTSEFLEQCDLVKFARHEPAAADMNNAAAAAERLIRETTPVAAPAQEGAP